MVAVQIEKEIYDKRKYVFTMRRNPSGDAASALTAAACSVAFDMKLSCIVCYTSTGATALRAARQRPETPLLVLTTKYETARRLAAVWGLYCVLTDNPDDSEHIIKQSGELALKHDFGTPQSKMIVAAGLPIGTPGATNMLRIANLNGDTLPK
jgi:pyruvate kinase